MVSGPYQDDPGDRPPPKRAVESVAPTRKPSRRMRQSFGNRHRRRRRLPGAHPGWRFRWNICGVGARTRSAAAARKYQIVNRPDEHRKYLTVAFGENRIYVLANKMYTHSPVCSKRFIKRRPER